MDWSVEKDQVGVKGFSKFLVIKFSHFNALTDLPVIPPNLNLLLSELCSNKDHLKLGPEWLKL